MKFQFLPENFSRSENAPPFETRKIRHFEVERIFLENKKMLQEKREIQITHGEFAEAWNLCQWCDSLFPESELQEEHDLGYLCGHCISAISSRGEEVWLKN